MDTSLTDTSVYVHFPWCLKRCPYCDFATRKIDRPHIPHDRYADAVLAELALRTSDIRKRRLKSVFFGGGTPSLWRADALGRVLNGILSAFGQSQVSDDCEVTVECNPSSLDAHAAAELRSVGVNRLSIGVQSLSDERLRFLGRFHDAQQAIASLEAAQRVFSRVSADLMFGMPGQPIESLEAEVEQLRSLGVQHLSAYSLTIEPGTQFGELYRKGRLKIASEDDTADMFVRAETRFGALGFEHYEVSNYALPGEASRHNLHYWQQGDYLGIGAGAVGCLSLRAPLPTDTDNSAEGNTPRARRYRNQPVGEAYMEAVERAGEDQGDTGHAERLTAVEESHEVLDRNARAQEALMLGLRTRRGIDLDRAEAHIGQPLPSGREVAWARQVERGNLVVEGGFVRVPQSRWLSLDSIVADLF